MMMKTMRFARRQLGTHEHQICVGDHSWFAMPEMGFAWKRFDFSFGERNDSPGGWQRICHEIKPPFRGSECPAEAPESRSSLRENAPGSLDTILFGPDQSLPVKPRGRAKW